MFGKKKEIEAPIRPAAVVEEPTVEIPKVEEPKPEPPKPPKPQTIIAEDVVMVGNFDTREPIVLLGRLKGNIHSTDSLSIAKTGSLIGEAAVDALSSDGHIEGSILCSNIAEFGSMAKMKGNLSTASLRTAEGSSFEGKLTMITKQAEEAAEEIVNEAEEVVNEAEEVVNEAAESIGEAAEAAGGFAADLGEAVEEKAGEFTDGIGEAAEEIVDDAQDISAEIFTGAEEAAGEAKDAIDAAAGEVRETVNQFSWN